MAEAQQFEYSTVGYDAMVVGRGGVTVDVVEIIAYRSFEKLPDIPVFDLHRPAPGSREPSCSKPREREIEAWEPPRLCPRCGEGTMERVPLAARVG